MNVFNFSKRHEQKELSTNLSGLETRVGVGVAAFVTNFIMLEDILEFIIKGVDFENPWGLSHSAIRSLRRCSEDARFKGLDSGDVFALNERELGELVFTCEILNKIFKSSSYADNVLKERIERLENIWKNHILDNNAEVNIKKIRQIRNNQQNYPLALEHSSNSWSIIGKFLRLTISSDKHCLH